ncbi:Ubiquinone biosynthesis O-methyltransferase [Marinomonas gallaica]|uniref:Ubiquinone biosynthesis O-methyltransferase n=1 Tax=Marinomonas gallaica TaxID=1806667 RepID=A0A1C3JP92_9GAMM|nr:class I SAM-dependent methyltransferase [Marinomonas gallaica]SBT16897.1 Ubiquinone biosynthesis O-methyltransferase [Marinomonas gallaica]SBT22152.1 Ubiquinone biosynthesis O-methyltransferase [Marinomonas gallaica]
MMTATIPHDLQPAWDLAGAQVQAKALEVALQKRLFEVLIEPQTVEAIAQKLALTSNKVSVWLELLWSMGYLEKLEESHFGISVTTQRYLLVDATQSCAQAVLFRLQTLRQFGEQFESLLSNDATTASTSDISPAWAQAAKAQIFEEQRAVTVPALERILSRYKALDFDPNKPLHCLDLGAGAGLISITLLQHFQNATGVAFDFPATADVAKQHIAEAGLSKRLAVQSGNLNEDYPTGQFDLIWCSSVLHFMDRPQQVLQRIAASLAPKGYLFLLHAEHSSDQQQAAKVLPFYTPMMMKGNYLPQTEDLSRQLKSVGLQVLQSEWLLDFPMAPVRLYLCQKGG